MSEGNIASLTQEPEQLKQELERRERQQEKNETAMLIKQRGVEVMEARGENNRRNDRGRSRRPKEKQVRLYYRRRWS